MLCFDHLNIRLGQRAVIEDLSLALPTKKCIGLLGANGAGKSTLLKAISQELPYQGRICWQEQDLSCWTTSQLSKKMGFLTQHSFLNFAFSVEEVVLLGRIMHSTSNQENERIARELMVLFEIDHLAKNNYVLLSGGEKQRVHAARVWAQLYEPKTIESKILLLDEPTSALDLKHQHLLLNQARVFAADNNIVIVVVHDLNLAARYCDCLLLLHNGQLVGQGQPKEVLTHENIKMVYDYDAKIIYDEARLIIQ